MPVNKKAHQRTRKQDSLPFRAGRGAEMHRLRLK